jgi:hypothetical protein
MRAKSGWSHTPAMVVREARGGHPRNPLTRATLVVLVGRHGFDLRVRLSSWPCDLATPLGQ